MPNQDQSVSLILAPTVLGTSKRDSPSLTHYISMVEDSNVKIPVGEEGVYEIAEEGEEEPGVTEEQRRNLAEIQARIFDL